MTLGTGPLGSGPVGGSPPAPLPPPPIFTGSGGSAGGLARLGIRCADASTGMATLGVYCGALVPPPASAPQPGGGSKRSRIHVPGVTSNRAIAMREDEEIVAVLQALLASRIKN